MTPSNVEALQLALLQELNDIEGVKGVASQLDGEKVTLLVYIADESCRDAVEERLGNFEGLPSWQILLT